MFTKKDIWDQLEKMNAPKNSVVLMHSSLRAVGEVENGGQGLLDAMVEYFTLEGGLLCIPTHTWGYIGKKDKITLDLTANESNLGALSRIAAADPRAIRSESPTHSMAVFGPREHTLSFVKDESGMISPTSPDSCYGKLFKEGGHVLLVGVVHNRNTYLHSVDEMLGVPDRLSKDKIKVTVKYKTGEIMEREMFYHHSSFTVDLSLRFPQYETAFRYHHAITDGFVGNAPTQLCDAVKMKEVMEMIWERSGHTDVLRDESPIPQKYYCL
ncbi:MAG: AAC(3) family N-acetyltransferase [Clostridia bacterium]|nr:AAC(3) family N-acetyltransferase [Clostridia bacterium]